MRMLKRKCLSQLGTVVIVVVNLKGAIVIYQLGKGEGNVEF